MFVSFFFFKQKTAYEMRISDWSSDVCSSDLDLDLAVAPRPHHQVVAVVAAVLAFQRRIGVVGAVHVLLIPQALQPHRRYLERNRREQLVERLPLPERIVGWVFGELVPPWHQIGRAHV